MIRNSALRRRKRRNSKRGFRMLARKCFFKGGKKMAPEILGLVCVAGVASCREGFVAAAPRSWLMR
jgi:hypothetical protein